MAETSRTRTCHARVDGAPEMQAHSGHESHGVMNGEPQPMERLAVIVPVFNRRELVLETLESIRCQSVPPWRLVVVDDGSTDGSADAVEAWLADNAMPCEVRLIRQANGGVSRARNRGADEAEGASLLTFLDSDDLWPVEFVASALATFRSHPDLIAASGDFEMLAVDEAGQKLWSRLHSWKVHLQSATRAIQHGSFPHPSATVFRAEVFQQAGRYPQDLAYGEDLVLAAMVSTKGPWGRIDLSTPSFFRRFLKTDRRHSGHLSNVFNPDALLLYAEILESSAQHQQCLDALKPMIIRRWLRAGKALAEAERSDEAYMCYAKVLAHHPWNLKARWRRWWL